MAKLHLIRPGRKSIEEIKSISDPVAHVMAAAEYFSFPPMTVPSGFVPETALLCEKGADFWMKAKAVPLCKVAGRMTVAFADPFDLPAREEVGRICGGEIWSVVAAESEVVDALNRVKVKEDAANPALALENIMKGQESDVEVSSVDASKDDSIDATVDAAGDAPVIRMVNSMMIEALKTKASDIHFEALEKTSRLRYRIDGALVERPSPPKALHNAVVSRIKIMSNLDIAERRIPQDGRFKIRALKKEVDVRVSILPTVHGEKVVMRILDKANLAPGLSSLGLDDYAYKAMKFAIDQPHGIILVTGPTGSGKTTTLYSVLRRINTIDSKLLTAEEPVEYDMDGIVQVPINHEVGNTFAKVLRAFLRQDPDIIMVGEIRDLETAEIAIQAALTGHLVFSTLHTNDAAGAVMRFVDMNVAPYMVASTLEAVLGQRLLRTCCKGCKEGYDPDDETLDRINLQRDEIGGRQFFFGKGCKTCNGTGYKGRKAIFEYLRVTNPIRELINARSPTLIIREKARELGMRTMREDGVRAILDGYTTVDEVLRYT